MYGLGLYDVIDLKLNYLHHLNSVYKYQNGKKPRNKQFFSYLVPPLRNGDEESQELINLKAKKA